MYDNFARGVKIIKDSFPNFSKKKCRDNFCYRFFVSAILYRRKIEKKGKERDDLGRRRKEEW